MALGLLVSGEQARETVSEVDEALAAVGLYAERSEDAPQFDECWLWPENLPALQLFNSVQTQWTVGPVGPVGLNYPGVRASPAFLRIPEGERESVFEGACVMERAYLAALAERAAQRAK